MIEAIKSNRESAAAIKKTAQRNARSSRPRSVLVEPPKRLVYHTNKHQRSEFDIFVKRINSELAKGRKVTIDFREIVRLYPCGVLLLMGLIDQWKAEYPGLLGAKYPKDDLAEQMLQHVNILQDLGLEARKDVTHDDVNRWYYMTGSNVDTGPFERFMQDVKLHVGEEASQGLYESISEAITNVRHHAYDEREQAPWWAFCTVSDRKIFVALHDRGSTIPKTLLEKQSLEDVVRLRKLRRGAADGEIIANAVGGRTRTRLSHRGKGLRDMYAFTRDRASSELGIYSRDGFFQYIPALPKGERRGMIGHKVSGTLIMWLISLDGEKA